MDQENTEVNFALIKLEILKLKKSWRIVSFLVAVVLTFDLVQILPKLTSEDSYRYTTIIWIVAILAYMLSMIPQIHQKRDLQSWWQAHSSDVYTVGVLTLVAFLLRVWNVGITPFVLAGDEASQGLESIRVINGQLRNPFETGWLGVPTLSFFFNSISLRFLGRSILALRLPWALVGTVTVGITYFLVKQISGTRLALATAMLLATYHYHIHFSRLGSNQIADPFFMSLSLLFFLKAINQRSNFHWSLMGLTAGLALYFYTGARLTPVVIILVLGYYLITKRLEFWNRHKTGMLIAFGAFLVSAAPMIQFAVRFPDVYNQRINQIGIIQSGWLSQEPGIRGVGLGSVLFDQFRRASLAFNYYPDRTVWYGLQEPLLSPFFGILFILGMILIAWRLLKKRTGMGEVSMLAWWWSGMIFGGMLTENPPSAQRLITLAIPVCFFIAFASWEIIQFASKYLKEIPANTLLFVLVLAFGNYSYQTYFIDYSPQRIYGGNHAEMATEIAPLLNELGQDYLFYFFGPPEMYWGFATIPFLAPNAEGIDILEPITEEVSSGLLPTEKGAVYIFLPARLDELIYFQEAYPNGEFREFFSPVNNELIVAVYILPAQQ